MTTFLFTEPKNGIIKNCHGGVVMRQPPDMDRSKRQCHLSLIDFECSLIICNCYLGSHPDCDMSPMSYAYVRAFILEMYQ